MILKENLELINKIEEDFPVHTLTFQGIQVWVVIRLLIFENSLKKKKTSKTQKPAVKKSILTEILTYLNIFWQTFVSIIRDFKNSELRLRKAEIVYVSATEHGYEMIDGKHFSKFANSTFHFLQPTLSIINLVSSSTKPMPYPRYYPSFNINYYLHSALFFNKFKRKSNDTIQNFDAFLSYLEKENLINHLIPHANEVKKAINLSLLYKKVFLFLFKRINPKVVFLTCFYSKENFGLTLAANQLGIKTIEVQHGQQGDYHNMYTSWKNIPSSGYELLPTHFWMWGKRSADRVKKWADKTNRHQTIIGGNPWLAFYKSKLQAVTATPSDGKVRILISLQLPYTLFESFLDEAVAQSPNNYRWYVRMHPKFSAQAQAIKSYFTTKGGDKIIFEEANEMNIYNLFQLVDFHVTFWSTTAYEALVFDVPTILVHSNGRDAMKAYIDAHIFKYAKNATELLTAIDTNEFKEEKDKYIYADGDLIVRRTQSLIDS